jgi:uncharacterized protein YbbC (DUF1343 family)
LEDRADCVRGKRLGLIANPSSVDTRLRHAVDVLHEHPDIQLDILFGPEHGLRGFAQDQIELEDEVDAQTGLPVVSLYGPCRTPTSEMLRGLDALVFDIQDIGSRYYTYIWTMAHAMEACAREDVEMIVCDRPNPLGGNMVEGNLIEDGFTSFVGLYPIPNRHGMTVGELAGLFNETFEIGCRLKVIPMEGWTRSQWHDETGLPWVMPSPNMPTLETAIVYPGMCLVEGTNVSEGRGTTRPFEIIGAPWIEPHRLVRELERENHPGVSFRALHFQPTFHKFAEKICGGVQLHVSDRRAFRPLRTAVAILGVLKRLWPTEFAWREPPYEYESERPAFDILMGNDLVRYQIESGASTGEIEAAWQDQTQQFFIEREPFLLYR